jgi:hypothetical protein
VETVEPVGEWFDLWHAHPNDGDAIERWANLLASWARADESGRSTGLPWQSWLVIDLAEPRDDAVYLHTPNPSRDNFPYPFEGVTWCAEPPGWTAPAVGLEFGLSRSGDVELLWALRPQAAEPGAAADGVGR